MDVNFAVSDTNIKQSIQLQQKLRFLYLQSAVITDKFDTTAFDCTLSCELLCASQNCCVSTNKVGPQCPTLLVDMDGAIEPFCEMFSVEMSLIPVSGPQHMLMNVYHLK